MVLFFIVITARKPCAEKGLQYADNYFHKRRKVLLSCVLLYLSETSLLPPFEVFSIVIFVMKQSSLSNEVNLPATFTSVRVIAGISNWVN
jgi:hypothetical protein